jgi:hypothetical protein
LLLLLIGMWLGHRLLPVARYTYKTTYDRQSADGFRRRVAMFTMFDAARQGSSAAKEELLRVAADEAVPKEDRLYVVPLMGLIDDRAVRLSLLHLLLADDMAVRFAAWRALPASLRPDEELLNFTGPVPQKTLDAVSLLSDRVRSSGQERCYPGR